MNHNCRSTPIRTVIGIDCATQPRKVGLAVGTAGSTRLDLKEVAIESSWDAIDVRIKAWVSGPTLLAIDAPLGWPAGFGDELVEHRAGCEIETAANQIFRRRTDDAVFENFGKRPLDVGSNLIARTAHSAISLLGRLRRQTGDPIPLAWDPDIGDSVQAIEAYPAATLRARRLSDTGYKGGKKEALSARAAIVRSLVGEVSISAPLMERCEESDHVLDAVLCVVAGFDFLGGLAIPPNDLALALREGWIWVRRPQ